MADLEMLRRLWAAFGCEANPDDFRAAVQLRMWEQVVEFARSSAAQDRVFDRERREALAEVERLRDTLAASLCEHGSSGSYLCELIHLDESSLSARADAAEAGLARVRKVADELGQANFLFPDGQRGVVLKILGALDGVDRG